ncbi:MAG: AEC family transporter [Eubacteriales bacterium]|nr:AEC family transporter [Eubacteriales bacterium]
MQQAMIVQQQVLMIFIYVTIGIGCVKKNILTQESCVSLSRFALVIISPCLIAGSYIRPYDSQAAKGLLLSFGLAVLYHAIATLLSVILIPKREDQKHRIERMGTIFSNCGYMAIPLINAAVGPSGVFYAVPFISVFTVLLWSEGVILMTDRERVSWKQMFVNPGFLSFLVGLAIYFLRIPIPSLINQTIDSIKALNTPITMITVGCFLAGVSLKNILKNRRLYYVGVLRLIVFPMVFLLLLCMMRVSRWLPCAEEVEWALLLACACSAPASTTQFPAMYGQDSVYGAQIVAVTVLFSVITIPMLTLMAQGLF